jgi:adenine-specific DNA-methyltransferase
MEEKLDNPMNNILSQDWNKERLEQLKQLMPDLFTNDGKLNVNELKQIVDADSVNETERYEFRWFGKSKAKREAFTPTDATLVFDDERSVNPENSENLIIEGDNLNVLKLFSKSYREKIKCIYIDPPYNTGNDFVYNDNYSQEKKEYWEDSESIENGIRIDSNSESDGRYHSNWLNMMYSRLLIARQLMREDGLIFISIDDNEVHHLRKLCDEVFGEDNFIDCIIWKKRYGGGAKEKFLVSLHEYILVYAKDVNFINPMFIPLDETSIKRYYTKKDENFEIRGGYRTHPLEATKSMGERKNLVYAIPGPEGDILPKRQWLWGKERALEAIKTNELEFVKDRDGSYTVHTKQYLKDENGLIREGKAFSIIDDIYTQHGTNEIIELFGNAQIFSFPKPTKLIIKLLEIALENDDEIVLDMFAGSGSTGQAINEINKQDDGNRKFILVQIPEATDEKGEAFKAGYKKISDITIERNKRVINNIIEEKKKAQPNLFSDEQDENKQLKGLGFKVFKLQKSNFPRTEFVPDSEKTEEENIEELIKYIKEKEAQLVTHFNKDELITEILLKNGFKLNYTVTQQNQFKKNEVLLATDGEKETLLCLDNPIDDETIEYFKTNSKQKLIVLERSLNTTKKWNLKHYLGDKFNAF